jgi:hypothetical protein
VSERAESSYAPLRPPRNPRPAPASSPWLIIAVAAALFVASSSPWHGGAIRKQGSRGLLPFAVACPSLMRHEGLHEALNTLRAHPPVHHPRSYALVDAAPSTQPPTGMPIEVKITYCSG